MENLYIYKLLVPLNGKMFHITFFCLLITVLEVCSTDYSSQHVYEIVLPKIVNPELLQYLSRNDRLDFWSPLNKVGRPSFVGVHVEEENNFLAILNENNVSSKLIIKDLKTTLENEKNLRGNRSDATSIYDQYLTYDEINKYLDTLSINHPDLVTIKTIGQSYEGRDIRVVSIASGSNQNKPTIFMDAGIHAREWISPAFALYIITELVKPENQRLIKDVNWLIIPSANPDGYVYSWETDRLWRKTRSPGKQCFGVDPNRNFDFHWMEAGASFQECAQDYGGKKVFSEIEVETIAKYMKSADIDLYLSIHSCGQYLIYPWSWTFEPPSNWEELDMLGNRVADAIYAVNGTKYTVGESTEILYYAAGCSDDYAMGVANVSLVFVVELPCGGQFGFDLPEDRILQVCEETFPGVIILHDYLVKLKINSN